MLLSALLLDLVAGEPKAAIHPTAWFGKLAGFFDGKYKRRSRKLDFISGFLCASAVIGFATCLSFLTLYLPFPVNFGLEVFLLKTTFSVRSLVEHVMSATGENKRDAVQKIVSRDVSELDEHHINSAAIESLAENTVDGFIAPLFYYLLFGLPGAMLYRAVNTLDAMIGYRNDRYEYFGKFAARFDDALNFIPSRLIVILFLPFNPKRVWQYYRAARFKINGDKPIACMSAVLGVWLEKKGVYRFNGSNPEIEDIKKAVKVFWVVVAEWVFVCTFISIWFITI